jgi:tripartite-type tricarboxylate transporter receptor subunit TctC
MKGFSFICAIAWVALMGAADAADDFYAGKKITIGSYGGAGNNYDAYSRMVARHLGKYIPGNPSLLVVNQPGAGGLMGLNYASRIAPQDGTFISLVSDGLLMFEATGRPGIQDSLAKFKWLGALSSSNVVTVSWYKSGVKTLDDAKRRDVRLGGSGAGAMSSMVPELYNAFVGTRFLIIQGYVSAPEQNLAMDRGELDGRGAASWTSFKNLLPKEIAEGKLHVLGQIGPKKDEELRDVPLLIDLVAHDPKKLPIAQFVSRALTLSRSLAAPPGVPDERVAILRKAIAEMIKDPDLLAEVTKLSLDIGFVPGPEVELLIKQVLATPKDVVDGAKVLMKLQ